MLGVEQQEGCGAGAGGGWAAVGGAHAHPLCYPRSQKIRTVDLDSKVIKLQIVSGDAAGGA